MVNPLTTNGGQAVADAAVLCGLIQKLDCIDERVKTQAKSKLKEWFGNYDESRLEE